MAIIKQDYGSLGNDVQTQMLIAPVLAEMIATQAFAIDDQFIVDNVLYKATKAIAIGDAISVGTSTTDNCILSDSITQQISDKTDYFEYSDISAPLTTIFTYLMDNMPSGRTITGKVTGDFGRASFIGYAYPERTYGSVLFFTVAASGAVQFGLRRANTDTIKTISGS